MKKPKMVTIAEAARMLGYKSKRTILRLGEQGLLVLHMVRGRWMVERAQVRTAKVLTTGRVAKLVGCSKKTIYRRIKAGVVTPVRPDQPADWMSERALPRLSLEDVTVLRASIQRRHSSRSKPAEKRRRRSRSDAAGPYVVRGAGGRLWLRAHDRWWRLASRGHADAR